MASSDLPSVSPPGFRAEPADVYAFVDRFFAGLRDAGVEHVVISPGSRSTPLAIGAARCRGLRSWIELDERCAAFFALGLARASGRPAALICTSGTAAANYLPAIVEAHYGRVPLLALTADRPPELRDWGAGQTIDQPGLYGRYPRWSVEVPVPTAGEAALRLAARLAARAVECAAGGPAGPVHLNWPLREPLEPPPGAPPTEERESDPGLRFTRSRRVADPADVEALVELVGRHERGLVCCGPMDPSPGLAAAIGAFADRAGWPILADPASSLRAGDAVTGAPLLDMGDALARSPELVERLRPEVVIRLGEPPVSKAQRLWIESSRPQAVWWLDEGGAWGEPSGLATRVVVGGAADLLARSAERLGDTAHRKRLWCQRLEALDASARTAFAGIVRDPEAFCGLSVAETLARSLPAEASLFASNSMAIRLLDLGLARRAAPLRVLCNRGASGIDGVTSTALGMAAATGRPSALLTGDLAFLHDLGGLLLASHESIPLTIVVLDDDGGGIFSFLPVARQGEAVDFQRLFHTPHGLDLSRAARLFELPCRRVGSVGELAAALEAELARPGVSILHVPIEARHNEARFRACLAKVCEGIDAELAT